jgi:predicted phosphodiesterase
MPMSGRCYGQDVGVRVAVFSDPHGNAFALDAVLRAAAAEGVNRYWCLGDVAAHGPQPAKVASVVRGLPSLLCVRGNTDRYVLTGDVSGMIPPIDRPTNPEGFRILADARESFAWTRGCLVGSGDIDWLAGLPLEHRTTLPDGTRVLLVHSSPARDDGPGLSLDATDEVLASRGFSDEAADLVLVGHTHVPGERQVRGCHAVNPGSVSLPPIPDDLARWLLLDATASGYTIHHRSEPYDLGRAAQELALQRHPSAKWLSEKMTSRR